MKQTSKLKPVRWIKANVWGIIAVAIFFTIFTLIRSISVKDTADMISGGLYIAVTLFLLVIWFKTFHIHVIPILLMNMMFAVYFFTGIQKVAIIVNVCLMIILIFMIIKFLQHTFVYRKILELAAKHVTDTKNGFTTRPLPAGKSEYSQGEIMGLSDFLEKNTIAIPYRDSNGIILTFPEDWLGRKYDVHGSYLDDTRITFNNDGNVSAVISKKDYYKYRDELTFDQLCESFGQLFIEFLELYKKGDTNKILQRIKG